MTAAQDQRVRELKRIAVQIDDDLYELRIQNIKLKAAGRALGEYLLALGRGEQVKLTAEAEASLREALKLFECRSGTAGAPRKR